ncbi:MAG: tetratricopeptide repeat protein [Thermoguttaceae bacterium]|nr:tetratricopeptide repeat protein [Thermoguttaceae bacterium]
MKKSVFIISAAFSALCVFLTAASLSAQEETPETLYARGVSLFFCDRYDEAEACFRKGIELSPDNPANYYFLGVAQLRLGRAEEAGESFAKGAEAELTPRGRLVDVPGHLLRIQGDERLLIEQIRRRAALEHQEKMRRFNEALFGDEIQHQRRRLEAGLRSGQTPSSDLPPAAGLPLIPPIRPLFSPEVNGYISEELADSDREGFINLQKDERLDENGNVVKLNYLSTEAKRRAEMRRTIAEDRRIAKENFVDIFGADNTESDNTTFDGGTSPAKSAGGKSSPNAPKSDPRTKNKEPQPPKNVPVGEPAPFGDEEFQ